MFLSREEKTNKCSMTPSAYDLQQKSSTEALGVSHLHTHLQHESCHALYPQLTPLTLPNRTTLNKRKSESDLAYFRQILKTLKTKTVSQTEL